MIVSLQERTKVAVIFPRYCDIVSMLLTEFIKFNMEKNEEKNCQMLLCP